MPWLSPTPASIVGVKFGKFNRLTLSLRPRGAGEFTEIACRQRWLGGWRLSREAKPQRS